MQRQELEARREQLLWVAYRQDWAQQYGLAVTWENALTLFKRRLAEAVACCQNHYAQSLWTPALEPASLLRNPIFSVDGQFIGRFPSTAEREAIVNVLANRRSKLLAEHGEHTQTSNGDLAGGRLLLFDPDGTLNDGAAHAQSDGFFNCDNVPAWDT